MQPDQRFQAAQQVIGGLCLSSEPTWGTELCHLQLALFRIQLTQGLKDQLWTPELEVPPDHQFSPYGS